MMKACCDKFSEWYDSSTKRGFSINGEETDAGSYFVIEFRAVDLDTEKGIDKKELEVPNYNLTFSGNCAIQFCPFCGTSLAKVIKRNKGNIEFRKPGWEKG